MLKFGSQPKDAFIAGPFLCGLPFFETKGALNRFHKAEHTTLKNISKILLNFKLNAAD